MRVYLDVNIMLDYVIGRKPGGLNAASVVSVAQLKKMHLVTSPNSFVMCYYYVRKLKERSDHIKHSLALIRQLIDCVDMNGQIIDAAIQRKIPEDLEDSVQVEAAIASQADIFITNDKKLRKTKAGNLEMMFPLEFISKYSPI